MIKKNREFIKIIPMLLAHFSLGDPAIEIVYHPVNLGNAELGKLARAGLAASREVEVEEILQALGTPQEFKERGRLEEEKIKKIFSYKNKKSIYKYMDTINVDIDDKEMIIYPSHQDSLDGFTGISKNKQRLKFSYPLDITDEELGKAIYEAFTHCTSIYR